MILATLGKVSAGTNLVIFYRVRNKVNQNYTEPELTGLVKFDAAKQAIETAARIDEVKDIRDRAEAFRAYAKQAHFSLGMQNQCAEIKVRAERKAGELLKEMDLHEGGRPTENLSHDVTGFRLCELGINRMQSSRWQQISNIPEEDFEERLENIKRRGQELTSRDFLSLAGYLQREREREKRREMATEEAKNTETDDRIQIRHGDFREVMTEEIVPSSSVSLVLTDLPYEKEYLHLWDSLGKLAHRALKDGGTLAAYSGCTHLPEILETLSRHLNYCWTAAILNKSFADTIFHPMRVKSLWKPIVLFSKGKHNPSANENPSARYLRDVIEGDGLENINKQEHPWQQGVGESSYLIEVLSLPGDVVMDPCCGSGTVAVACKRLNRRFVGSDVDKIAVDSTIARLNSEPPEP